MTIDVPTPEEIRATLAGAVPGIRRSATIGRVRGDHDGNPGMAPTGTLRLAAVLVPLVERPDGLSVLLTQRTAHLHDHAGQISFPGGRIEPDDPDAVAAALRETEEEIGLHRQHVDVVGRLDTYQTRTSYEVTPVVGLVKPPFELKPDPFEVADIFEVPLAFVLDPRNRERRSRVFQGAERHFWVLPYPDRYIWGATAGMLVNLAEVLAGETAS
ncbi:MAG: CoA pyrophosphatase [Alphaproteobacteria bacterium]|nr:CoA pyrophosphatase [Alphaproteobacteria bacterium]